MGFWDSLTTEHALPLRDRASCVRREIFSVWQRPVKAVLRADRTLQGWSGRRSDRRAPCSASCICSKKTICSKKKARQELFAGRFQKATGCLSQRTTPVRFKNDTCPLLCVSWHRQHCPHRFETKTTCGTVHQEQRCAMRGDLHGQRGLRGQPGLRTLGDFTGLR